ncbi:MAG: NrfD/PsrC family molybdoenzyme membrane anchor subunit [Reichenbachiella sp.]|uniref:NrfD/PsrC family molybdoenzyme membrane anchor subunit n=1 Tax=Reichenbachiella sp. TaxID=2184521 RepID=UPI0032677008
MEEIIVIGKSNPGVYPVLDVWGWEISVYLFLGGAAAGTLFFAAIGYLLGKEDALPMSVKNAIHFVPPALLVGLFLLFLDLHHKLNVWRLYTSFSLESPMSWGAWTLLVITPLSILWWLSYHYSMVPRWKRSERWLRKISNWSVRNRKILAWMILLTSVVLGVYTGILLSAFNARPLWNSSILGVLFFVSGLSVSAALIQWLSASKFETALFRKFDLGLIGLEIFLIIHLFMGLLSGSAVQIQAAGLFLGGPFTLSFWLMVFTLGLIVPAIAEVLEMFGTRVSKLVVPLLIIFGGLMLRIIIVNAGQVSSF